MKKQKIVSPLTFVCWFFLSSLAYGHSGSTAFLELEFTDDTISGGWWVALQDLHIAVGLDNDGDNRITYTEFQQQSLAALAYAEKSIDISAQDRNCPIQWQTPQLSKLNNGLYVHLPMQVRCQGVSTFNYSALFSVDDSHRAIVTVKQAGKPQNENAEQVYILSPENTQIDFALSASAAQIAGLYVVQGVIHILEGYDHLLFLLALLVPIVFSTVIIKNGNNIMESLKPLGVSLLKVVSAFTLGHSITLILASVFEISPPIAWVETVIAMSVVLAGVNIVWPFFRESSWKVAAVFGLIHCFGFASVLAELSLSRSDLITSLLSFNIGVEIGQLFIVLVTTPIFLLLCRGQFIPIVARFGAAGTAGCIGMVWVSERLPI